MSALSNLAITQLMSTGIDFNVGTAQTIFTVPPTSNYCLVTHVIIYCPSASLTTASVSFGWNNPDYNDVIENSTYTELATSSMYTVIPVMDGATRGPAGAEFKMIANVLEGSAADANVYVFGYYI
jgi:hypothetical protein